MHGLYIWASSVRDLSLRWCSAQLRISRLIRVNALGLAAGWKLCAKMRLSVLVEIWSDIWCHRAEAGAEAGRGVVRGRSAWPRRFVKDTDDDQRAEDHQGQDWFAGTCQAAWQCEPSLQNAWLFARQLLPVQGTLRQRRRSCIARDQPQEAHFGEPGRARD